MPKSTKSTKSTNELTPQESLELMQKASSEFYQKAIATNCHAFIEFTGLMNEYIKICRDYQQNNPNHDFREHNQHTGYVMKLQPYQADYIKEKLHCIYQNEIFSAAHHD
ncbi:hypothetical protein [Laspinema palackyanum]|uniref:hypothetical protein n=1 Tax=Laspinema palackyanum TaxID=3231601 RepID=UPI00345CE2F1|nr:hypothetical protein [Laspinema sp. D2c]